MSAIVMSYDFKNLSWADFEDLVRDLIGKELHMRFEAFCSGPDGGIDGRHSQGGNDTILQAKHYEGSPFSKLKSAMKRERMSINHLAPSRYILATTCNFTPPSKAELATIIGPSLKSEDDIFGLEDINGLLRKYPDILRAHIKLWLSSAGVLDRVLRSAAYAYATLTREDIEQKVRVYAPNPSFDQSFEKLEEYHVLIISGPPGVGKTTLAEMLCYTFLSEGWELVPIRSLDDGFASIVDSKKQIFLFDDFLGRVALDKQALAHKDSELARFMNRIRRSSNARFILTTRGYIFEEARSVSEHLGDTRLDVSKYVLDVGIYTRRIKARILYNHLLVAGTPKEYIRTLIEGNILATIIDHQNYNPRVIEAMTDIFRIRDIAPVDYPNVFLEALKNPSQIWDVAFRTHIDDRCRHLLLTMFFSGEHGVLMGELRLAYEALHSAMSKVYGLSHGPKDFEESLRILEGSFINIEGESISYLNPSLKDYLSSYLLDPELLVQMVPTAKSINWVHSLWKFVTKKITVLEQQKRIAQACISLLGMFEKHPTWRPSRNFPGSFEYGDAPNSIRLTLLIEWWQITNDVRFADSVMVIAKNPIQGFTWWRDGSTLVDYFSQLSKTSSGPRFIYEDEFLALIEKNLIELIRNSDSEALSSFADDIEAARNHVPADVTLALQDAVLEEFSEINTRVQREDSESALNDKIDELKRLAPRYGVDDDVLKNAISTIENRIAEIEDDNTPALSPQFKSSAKEIDKFDDEALRNLFTPLLSD
jgi:Restriction endonuclease